jgi:hypothetical protein
MIDPRHDDLLEREIDGENSPEESAALRELIARRPEIAARYEQLAKLAQTLERVKRVEPPTGLVDEVLRRIRQRQAPADRPVTWIDTLRAALRRQPALRYGFAFATGLALGVLVAALGGRSSPFPRLEGAPLSGTILPDLELARLETLSVARLDFDGVRGEATTKLGVGKVLAEIQLDSGRPLDLELGFDGNMLTPLAFQQTGAGRDVVLGPHELRFRHSGGGRYALVLAVSGEVPPPLRLKLSANGVRLERTLTTRREGS